MLFVGTSASLISWSKHVYSSPNPGNSSGNKAEINPGWGPGPGTGLTASPTLNPNKAHPGILSKPQEWSPWLTCASYSYRHMHVPEPFDILGASLLLCNSMVLKMIPRWHLVLDSCPKKVPNAFQTRAARMQRNVPRFTKAVRLGTPFGVSMFGTPFSAFFGTTLVYLCSAHVLLFSWVLLWVYLRWSFVIPTPYCYMVFEHVAPNRYVPGESGRIRASAL